MFDKWYTFGIWKVQNAKTKDNQDIEPYRVTAQAIEKIARQERRSFTRQVELMLENALSRRQSQPVSEGAA
jgi:hypothetical protein